MRQETVKLSCGCLLHDIGKLVYRAGEESGSHSSQGFAYMKKLWPDEKEILACIKLHHSAELRADSPSEDSLAWIAYVADNLSAAADRRENEEGSGNGFNRYLPLQSVFTHLNGEHNGFTIRPYPGEELKMPERGGAELNAQQYQAAVEALKIRLAELPAAEEWLDSLLSLLETHTSVFPSSTYTGESADISLYDHLKTTAAIGACIGEYLAAQGERNFKSRLFINEKKFRGEKAFILYSADFSGIQRFIYQVSTEKALRSLRSRSFFLEIAMEHYIDELLKLCGVSRANLLYSGGGHCYILLPNTGETVSTVEDWNKRFNSWLSEEFGISLYLAHGYTACSGDELTNVPAEDEPYKAVFRRVSSDIAKHKLHRYDAQDLRRLNRSRKPEGRECIVCGRTDSLSDRRCPWCNLFIELSEKIQKKSIFYVSHSAENGYDFVLPAADGSAYFSLTDEKDARARLNTDKAVIRVYSKNVSYTGLRYSTRINVGDYVISNSMEELSNRSLGISRIGICRMDVDNLGQSFVSGFEKTEKSGAVERQHFVTISRTAAFSRQLSLFFKHHINGILSGSFRGKKPLAVMIVYSGGDDVFLVGAWNDTIEAAVRIREALREFSCGALTISGGIRLEDEHFPIRLAAARAGALEDRAKDEPDKDSVALFDASLNHVYKWQRFNENVRDEKLALLNEFFGADEQERGSSFLYKMLDLLRTAQEKDGRLQLARYAYLLSRMKPASSSPARRLYDSFSKKMYEWAMDASERACLITAIYIFVYENRKGDKK